MRICKNCQEEITDDDIKYCSRCGADLSKDENLAQRSVSDAIKDEVGDGDGLVPYVTFKVHKRWLCATMQMLIGFTGASFFYLGFWWRGLIWIGINLIFVLIAGFTGSPFWLFCILFVNVAMGLGWIFKKDLIDSRGNDLS